MLFRSLRPHLNVPLRAQMDFFGQFSMWIVILLLWYVPFVSDSFWMVIDLFAMLLGIPLDAAYMGYSLFRFWQ